MVFFKSGVTRADLKQDGKTADSNDKFTIRVMKCRYISFACMFIAG